MKSDEALRRFFEERPAFEAYAFAATRDYHATQDILQEAAVIVVSKAESYTEDKPFRPWALGIVRLELLSWLRTRNAPVRALDPATLDECIEEFADMQQRQTGDRRREALAECLQTLSDSGQHVLSMRYAGRQTCEQIAGEMQRSVQAVYAMIKRLKAALRDCVTTKLGEATR